MRSEHFLYACRAGEVCGDSPFRWRSDPMKFDVLSIAMTNGPCEGPHPDSDPSQATRVVSFRTHPSSEMITALRLCDACRKRCEQGDGVSLILRINDRATLEFQ